jgi:hypothetical protein
MTTKRAIILALILFVLGAAAVSAFTPARHSIKMVDWIGDNGEWTDYCPDARCGP